MILAGGVGSRLWPLSRAAHPKQFHPLLGDRSLLQNTLLRAARVAEAPPIVICNESHRFLVAEQMGSIRLRPERVVLEPEPRGTAPAIALAAHYALAERPAARLLVLPADHLVDESGFESAIRAAIRAAAGTDCGLLCFGVRPTRAETGYGYIDAAGPAAQPVRAVRAFVEKPDAETARTLAASGRHLWNSGMFLVDARTALAQIEAFNPAMARAAASSFAAGRSDGDFFRPGPSFAAGPPGSFDVVVMENTDLAAVLPVDFEWHDIGSWAALLDAAPVDSRGNHFAGDVLSLDATDCLIDARDRLVAAVGVARLVVVETADAVLVADRERAQEVRELVTALRESNRVEHLLHRRVHRPWGTYDRIGRGARHQVKHLAVEPGASISLQLHHHRAEHWVVVRGLAEVTRGEDTFPVRENESTYIPVGVKHRLRNPGDQPLELIEVQVGDYLGEDDIVRFRDDYGRASGNAGAQAR